MGERERDSSMLASEKQAAIMWTVCREGYMEGNWNLLGADGLDLITIGVEFCQDPCELGGGPQVLEGI